MRCPDHSGRTRLMVVPQERLFVVCHAFVAILTLLELIPDAACLRSWIEVLEMARMLRSRNLVERDPCSLCCCDSCDTARRF